MILAKVQVDATHISRLHCLDIPRGIIGAQVEIEYTDAHWDSLNKTVVFNCGKICKDVVTNERIVTIPSEVVQLVGRTLSIGVYGTDAEETVAIPTIRCDLGVVREAADPSHDESTEAELPVWAQLAAEIEWLKQNQHQGSAATIGVVELLAERWVGSDNLWSQQVSIDGVTENSQVDLTPSAEQLAVFHRKDLTFVTENEGGVVTVFVIGQKPQHDYTVQVTITEVIA